MKEILAVNDAVERRVRQQAAVMELGIVALGGAEIDSLMDQATRAVAETLQVEFCKVLEIQPGGDRLLLRAGVGWAPGLVGHATVSADTDSQAGFTLLSERPVVVEDLSQETRFSGPPLLLDHGIVSGISVVILGAASPFGVLGVHARSRRQFTQDEVHFVQCVANVLATAIQRFESQQALTSSEARFRALIEHSYDAISLVDQNGILLYGSPSATRMTGHSPEDYLGKSAFEQIHPDDLPHVQTMFAELVAEPDQTLRSQFRLCHKDQSWHSLEVTGTNLLSEPAVRAIVVNYRDIAEQRRADEALRESNERFEYVAKATNDAVWDWNLLTDVGWWNDGAYALFRYRPEQIPAAAIVWNQHLHPDDRDRVLHKIHSVIDGGGDSWTDEYRIVRADGTVAVVFDRGFILRDVNGKPYRMIGATQDITARKEAEETLRESQQSVVDLVNSVDGIVWEADARTFQFNFVSQQAERMLGYPLEHWLTEPMFWKEHVHPQDRDAAVEYCVNAARNGQSHQFEYRMLSADGREVWLKDNVVVVVQDGLPTKLRGIMVDITEHKRAEDALAESEQRFRNLFESSRDAIFVEDSAGHVLDVNPAACRLHGLTREQLLSMNARDLVPKEQRAVADRDFPKLVRGELTQTEGFSLHTDGTAVPVELSVSRIDYHGQPSLLLHVRDITARKQAEQAVRDNEARLMGLINTAMDAIITIDEDQNVVLFNPAAEKIFQCSRADVLGNSIHQFIPERFLATHDQQVRQFANSGTTIRAMGERNQVAGLRRDGSEFPAEASILKVQIGNQRFLTVILRDISERKRAEEKSLASEMRYRRLFEAAKDGILILEADSGVIVDVNPYLCELLGVPSEEIRGKELWELGFFKDVAANKAKFLDLQNAGYIRYENLPLETAQGRRAQVEFVSNVYTVENQNVIQCNIRDITERRRAEATLRESEERLRLALDAAHMGTFDWDVPFNRITWSRWHEELWGFEPGEFSGTYEAFAERVHPDDLPGINAEIARCIAAREPFAGEFRVVWPDGSIHWVIGRGEFTFDETGQPLRMRGAVVETTALKLAEEEIRQSRERLTALSRQLLSTQETERRRLARELHDELGQVLSAISINLKTIQDNVGPAAKSRLDDCIGLVDRAVDQVRNVSLDLRPAVLDDFGLIAALRWYVHRLAERTGLVPHLETNVHSDDLPAAVTSACFRVAQESLTNVSRHAHAHNVWLDLDEQQGELRLTVRDDGQGFDVDAARQRAARGGSLGLLSMQERVELLGGQCDIQSEPGRGATVRVRFPIRPTELAGEEIAEETLP